MQYGKLENGYIRYAPKTVTWQGHIVNNPDAEKLRELGYLPIRRVDMPTDAPEGKHYESDWEQTEDAIVQTWTLVEDEPVPEPPPTIEEQIAALQRALINRKIVGGGITNITDSSENKIKDIKIFGKSEQTTTTGKNLFDINATESAQIEVIDGKFVVFNPTGYPSADFTNIEFLKKKILESPAKKLSISCKQGSNIVFIRLYANILKGEEKVTYTTQPDSRPIDFTGVTEILGFNITVFCKDATLTDDEKNSVWDIQIELSDVATEYEPFTDGMPSPSPENPQPIRNVGKYNEETGKYDVDVIVSDGEESGRKQTITLSLDQPLRGIGDYKDEVTKDGVVRRIYSQSIKGESISSNEYNWDSKYFRYYIRGDVPVENLGNYSAMFTISKTADVYKGNTSIYWIIPENEIKSIGVTPEDSASVAIGKIRGFVDENEVIIQYIVKTPVTEPLPEDFKQALKNLSTYYPTTVVTVDGGEVYGDVELTYIADTKNYIDNQIKAVTGKQIETNKLILERMI